MRNTDVEGLYLAYKKAYKEEQMCTTAYHNKNLNRTFWHALLQIQCTRKKNYTCSSQNKAYQSP
jgi:hypothetical protein